MQRRAAAVHCSVQMVALSCSAKTSRGGYHHARPPAKRPNAWVHAGWDQCPRSAFRIRAAMSGSISTQSLLQDSPTVVHRRSHIIAAPSSEWSKRCHLTPSSSHCRALQRRLCGNDCCCRRLGSAGRRRSHPSLEMSTLYWHS